MQQFGGDWTEKKLTCLKKYLGSYTTIMSNQKTWNGKLKFRYAYIDAFAGTGYRELKEDDDMNNLLFPELAEEEPQTFLDGSARIALNTVPRFTKYIFIEKYRAEHLDYSERQLLYSLSKSIEHLPEGIGRVRFFSPSMLMVK